MCPLCSRAMPWCLTVNSYVPSGVCLPVSYFKGNCDHKGATSGDKEKKVLWFAEKRGDCFPLCTLPSIHPQAMLSPLGPLLCYFSLLIYDSEGIGRVVWGWWGTKKSLRIRWPFVMVGKKEMILVGFLTFTLLSFNKTLLGKDSMPGILLYQSQSWVHLQRYHNILSLWHHIVGQLLLCHCTEEKTEANRVMVINRDNIISRSFWISVQFSFLCFSLPCFYLKSKFCFKTWNCYALLDF